MKSAKFWKSKLKRAVANRDRMLIKFRNDRITFATLNPHEYKKQERLYREKWDRKIAYLKERFMICSPELVLKEIHDGSSFNEYNIP